MSNINVGKIVDAWRDILVASPDLGVKEVRIVRAGYVNSNPNLAPWIGLYKGRTVYEPRTLGRHSASWQSRVELQTMIQVFSAKSGEDAEDRIEVLIARVLRLAMDNPTIGGSVGYIVGLAQEYRFLEADGETAFFQVAMITITAEVATG